MPLSRIAGIMPSKKKYISENETVPLASISAMESCVP